MSITRSFYYSVKAKVKKLPQRNMSIKILLNLKTTLMKNTDSISVEAEDTTTHASSTTKMCNMQHDTGRFYNKDV
jgi:hypothetical protein